MAQAQSTSSKISKKKELEKKVPDYFPGGRYYEKEAMIRDIVSGKSLRGQEMSAGFLIRYHEITATPGVTGGAISIKHKRTLKSET